MAILAIFGTFDPVATGLFFRKIAKNSDFWLKWPKKAFLAGNPPFWGFWAILGPFRALAAGFYINPRRPLPGGGEGPLSPVPGPRGPGEPWTGSRIPIPGSWSRTLGPPQGEGDLPGGPGRGPGVPDGVPDTGAYGVLHQPLAPGPRGIPAGVPGSRGPGEPQGPPEGPFSSPGPGGRKPPLFPAPGNRGLPLRAHPPRG